jgi:hypothetical protein
MIALHLMILAKKVKELTSLYYLDLQLKIKGIINKIFGNII